MTHVEVRMMTQSSRYCTTQSYSTVLDTCPPLHSPLLPAHRLTLARGASSWSILVSAWSGLAAGSAATGACTRSSPLSASTTRRATAGAPVPSLGNIQAIHGLTCLPRGCPEGLLPRHGHKHCPTFRPRECHPQRRRRPRLLRCRRPPQLRLPSCTETR